MKNFPFYALIACLLTSCGTYTPITYVPVERQKENPYYVLPSVQAPLMSEKGDITGSFNFSFADQHLGFDFTGGAKPFDKVAFMIGTSIHSNGEYLSGADQESEGTYVAYRLELAPGYSTAINKNWMIECFLGGGFGSIENYHATGNSLLKQGHGFLLPVLGYINDKKTFELGFQCRLQGMHYAIDSRYYDASIEHHTEEQFENLVSNPWQWMVEPGFVIRGGGQKLKVQFATNYSQNLTYSDMDAKNLTFSVGMVFKLNTGWKSAKNHSSASQ